MPQLDMKTELQSASSHTLVSYNMANAPHNSSCLLSAHSNKIIAIPAHDAPLSVILVHSLTQFILVRLTWIAIQSLFLLGLCILCPMIYIE